MASSSFWVRRVAVFGLMLGTLPVNLMADPLTDVRCALADSMRLPAEASAALMELMEGHALLFEAPQGWTCAQIDPVEHGESPANGNVEFLCKRDSVKAIAKISGRASVDEMGEKLKQAWPKTFRTHENVFRRGPWELVIKDGSLLGILDRVATIEVAPASGTTLATKDLSDFVKTLNRISQTVPDLEAAEDRYSDATKALSLIESRMEASVSLFLSLLPSIVPLELQLGDSAEGEGHGQSRSIVGGFGFSQSMPMAAMVLSFQMPGTEPDPGRTVELQRCEFDAGTQQDEGTCLKHGSLVYWLPSERKDPSRAESRRATAPIGSGGLLTVLTFGQEDGRMTSDESLGSAEASPDWEGDGTGPQAVEDTLLAMGAANDADGLAKVVNAMIDEFEAAGGARLDLDRFPIGEGECD